MALEKNLFLQLNTFLHLLFLVHQAHFQSWKQDKDRPKQSSKTATVLPRAAYYSGPGFRLPLRGPWAAGGGVRRGGSEAWPGRWETRLQLIFSLVQGLSLLI